MTHSKLSEGPNQKIAGPTRSAAVGGAKRNEIYREPTAEELKRIGWLRYVNRDSPQEREVRLWMETETPVMGTATSLRLVGAVDGVEKI